ncbi:MAG: hypothetical protein WAT46_03895 [Saprospiraceae bacterium]
MQSPTKQKLQKIDDMTYEQAALQVLHFEYASFQEVDCELAADLKNASGVNTSELESRSCTTWYLYVWSGNTIIDAIYLDSSCTLHVIDGTGVVQEPFNSDTGGNTSFLSTSWFIKMLRIEFPGAWILDYYD